MPDSILFSKTVSQLHFDCFWAWAKPDPATAIKIPSTWLDQFAAFVYERAWTDCLTRTCNLLGKPPELPAKLVPFTAGDRRKNV